ncbi:hypothetical protein [Novosphingobium terrae]|nr:hypothetical protein [Novosphingobium terrae]
MAQVPMQKAQGAGNAGQLIDPNDGAVFLENHDITEETGWNGRSV